MMGLDHRKEGVRAFIAQLWQPADGAKLNRERAIVFLCVLFAVVSLFILPIEHGVGRTEPHLKDEEGYYGWAVLYTDGHYSLPMEKVSGRYRQPTQFSTEAAANAIDLVWTLDDRDAGWRKNDLDIVVRWSNGTPIEGAKVSIIEANGARTTNRTNATGGCIHYDIPFGRFPLEIVVRDEPNGTPLIVTEIVDAKMGMGQYTIHPTVETTALTDRALGRNVTVMRPRTNGAGSTPVTNATIFLDGKPIGRTNGTGMVQLPNGERQRARVGVRLDDGNTSRVRGLKVIHGEVAAFTDARGDCIVAINNTYRITVTVTDTFGTPVEGATISRITHRAINRTIAMGKTDSEGSLIFEAELRAGQHRLIAEKTVDGYDPPLASGVAEVDGSYHYVNHWPPGPSVLIAALIFLGLQSAFGFFIMLLLSFSTWGVARRIFNWKVAATATALVIVNGITFELYFGQWMGDLASTAFAMGGLWVTLVALDRHREQIRDPTHGASVPSYRGTLSAVALAALAGLLLGIAVTMRYSTIVACAMPYIVVLGITLKNSVGAAPGSDEKQRREGSHKQFLELVRRIFARENRAVWFAILVPLTLGMAAVGAMLIAYNATYFGGPFNSGYQSQTIRAMVETNASGNQTLSDYEPEESFFAHYFKWSEADRENAPYIFAYLLIFVPIFFAALPAIWLFYRKPVVIALFYWMIVTLVIYLSQSWVLSRIVEDIRYFMPLVPPAAILTASLLQAQFRMRRRLSLSRRAAFLAPIIAVALFIVATTAAGHYTVTSELHEAERGGAPPGGGRIPAPHGAPTNGVSLPHGDAVPIPILLASPQRYANRPVTVVHCVVDQIHSEHLLQLRDDRTPNQTLMLSSHEPLLPLSKGTAVEATGQFSPDRHRPDAWLLVVERAEDIVPVETENGYPPEPRSTPTSTRGAQLDPLSEAPTTPHVEPQDGAENTTRQPIGGQELLGDGDREKYIPLKRDLNGLMVFSIAGLALYYLSGATLLVLDRRRRNEAASDAS